MSDKGGSPLWLSIVAKFFLNGGLVWVLATYFASYFTLTGGYRAIIIVAALLTLMNMFFRPILDVLTLPLKLFATILAVIVVNGVFVYVIDLITVKMDPSIITLAVGGGTMGWIVTALLLGFGNWIIKEMVRG